MISFTAIVFFTGMQFWKQPSRKIFAVPEEDLLAPVRKKRYSSKARREDNNDDDFESTREVRDREREKRPTAVAVTSWRRLERCWEAFSRKLTRCSPLHPRPRFTWA